MVSYYYVPTTYQLTKWLVYFEKGYYYCKCFIWWLRDQQVHGHSLESFGNTVLFSIYYMKHDSIPFFKKTRKKTMFFKDSSRLKIYRQLKRLQRRLIFTIFIKEPAISAMKEAFFKRNEQCLTFQ